MECDSESYDSSARNRNKVDQIDMEEERTMCNDKADWMKKILLSLVLILAVYGSLGFIINLSINDSGSFSIEFKIQQSSAIGKNITALCL